MGGIGKVFLYPGRKKTSLCENMYETDNIDAKIVDLLMEDGRMPAAMIARRIGNITERVVRYRIDRMVSEGVIEVRPVVKPKAFGLTTVADVVLEVESDSILDVARKASEFENVSYVACSIGETDVSVQIVAKDTAEVYRFVTEVIGKFPGVRKTTTSIVPIVVKDVYQWRIPRSALPESNGKKSDL
jgi:Lrp/AsnC family transcriptional regulator, regulator for asnA, asnC and gidA